MGPIGPKLATAVVTTTLLGHVVVKGMKPSVPRCVPPVRGGARDAEGASSPTGKEAPSHSEKGTTKKSSKKKKKKKKSETSDSSTPSTSPIVESILKEDDYYKILGLTKDTLGSDPDRKVQKAYRKRAVQTHPDKTNGDRRAFDKVAEAYEVLQDAEKRRMYDKFGKKGLDQQMPQQGGEEFFRSFFGGGRQNPFFSGNRSMRFQLSVSLEDLYAGKSINVQLPDGKAIQVDVPKGTENNEVITISGALDSQAGAPGDVQFIVQEQPNRTFSRLGYDLVVALEISLAESISGVQRRIRHLDGSTIHVVSAGEDEHSVIQHNDVQKLVGYGMPKNEIGTEFGDLYIQYQIRMPHQKASLSFEERDQLQKLLNKLEGRPEPKSSWPFGEGPQLHRLQAAQASDLGRGRRRRQPDQEQPQFSPFGQQQFFFGSQQSNSFFGDSAGHSDQEQCRQM